MFNYNNNVFMQPYGNDDTGGGSGGSGGGGDDPAFNFPPTGGGGSSDFEFSFTDSQHSFTDPPRFYKANDPYYYEIDNIPLQQIHTNCLWLKDQVMGASLQVSGIPKRKLAELQPYVNNADRIINVRKGNFTARVNDAYRGGIASPMPDIPEYVIDINRTPIYQTKGTEISDSTFRNIVGNQVVEALYNNGLYEQFNHHASRIVRTSNNTVRFQSAAGQFSTGQNEVTVANFPKVRSAVWQSFSDVVNVFGNDKPDLRQLSVDFTRKWGGVFRTAVVNVAQELAVEIPVFEDEDFMSQNPSYDPKVRIDLVFVYTHAVDQTETTLASGGQGSLRKITKPALGVVKGAGGILAAKGNALPIADDATTIGSDEWVSQGDLRSAYYDTSQATGQVMDMAIIAPISDQNNLPDDRPFDAVESLSFPSPDDLLNLAPLLADNAIENDLALVGQSVLPLCYVIVKKGAPVILEEDIIDIRPFLRTTELAYNERAGIGGANPPISLANPVTTKAELYNAIEMLRDRTDDIFDLFGLDLENAIAGTVRPKPFISATTTKLFTQTDFMPWYDVQSQANDLPATASVGMQGVNGGTAMSEPTNGGTEFKLVRGRYHIKLDTAIVSQNETGNTSKWRAQILDQNDVILHPLVPDNNVFTFRAGMDSADFEFDAGFHMSAILDVEENGTTLRFKVTESSTSSSNAKNVGSVTITRIANLDGTEGTIN